MTLKWPQSDQKMTPIWPKNDQKFSKTEILPTNFNFSAIFAWIYLFIFFFFPFVYHISCESISYTRLIFFSFQKFSRTKAKKTLKNSYDKNRYSALWAGMQTLVEDTFGGFCSVGHHFDTPWDWWEESEIQTASEGGPDFRTWADVVVLGWLNTEYVSRWRLSL